MAKGGSVGLIPGKVNHAVADDVTINAKKGEYIIPEEVVSYLGVKFFNTLVEKTRHAIGAPQGLGAKTHNQTDNQGRRDMPQLQGITGLADGGTIENWKPKYETDLGTLAAEHPIANTIGLGIPAVTQKVLGVAGNIADAMFILALVNSAKTIVEKIQK